VQVTANNKFIDALDLGTGRKYSQRVISW